MRDLIDTYEPSIDDKDKQPPDEWQGQCLYTPGLDCYRNDCCRRPPSSKDSER